MVKFYLKLSATLEAVTNVEPLDTPTTPYEYTFTIECTKCRHTHEKPVNINRFESHEITGSRGEASFVFRCKECKSEHSATLTRTSKTLTAEDAEANKAAALLEIDARGVEFLEFLPEGRFMAVGSESGTKFDEVDLEDGEWYDYDDKAGAEVSVTECKWEISRS
jgi:ribosomal protein L44E